MEVRQGTISVCSNEDVLCDSWGTEGPPSEVGGGHLVLHVGVEHVALLLSEYVEDAD